MCFITRVRESGCGHLERILEDTRDTRVSRTKTHKAQHQQPRNNQSVVVVMPTVINEFSTGNGPACTMVGVEVPRLQCHAPHAAARASGSVSTWRTAGTRSPGHAMASASGLQPARWQTILNFLK